MEEPKPEQKPIELDQPLLQEPTAIPAEAMTGMLRRPLRAFRHRNYRLFFGGQMISLTGTWLQSVTQGWLVFQLTNSALLLGVVGALTSLPILAFSLIAGVVADRFSKRNLLVLTQACAMLLAFALGILTYTHVVTVYHIIAIGFLLGTVQSFDAPTRQSFVIEMVGREDLTNAIALNSATFNSARILGPAVAGVVIAWTGIAGTFFLNGVSFIPVIIALMLMRVSPVKREAYPPVLRSLKEGFSFIRGHRMIIGLLILTGVISIFSMPYMVLMPIFARDILKVGAKGLGYLVSCIGVGALIGALIISSLGDFKAKGKLLLVGNLTFCAMLVLFSYSRLMPVSMALLIGVGWGVMTTMALTNTLIQTSAPDHLRGRVMSVYVLMFMGLSPLGSLQSGVIAHWLGTPMAVRIGAIVCASAAAILSPRFMRTNE
jgi:MFS family permease